MSGQAQSLVLAVVTFRRPDDLSTLLPQLLEQARAVASIEPGLAVSVLVVDNDPQGSAAPVVAAQAAAVNYVREPQPGIGAARDRALTAAGPATDLLVFIDDDERPRAEWLATLLATWRASGAAAVAGAVCSKLPVEPAPWIVAGELFDRRHRSDLATGARLPSAATNNLLLDLRFVRAHRLGFDSAFGISGGEDELFTRRLVASGGEIVWCAEAVVDEEVRRDRVNRRWLLLRTFSYGAVDARIALALAGSRGKRLRVRLGCFVRGSARIGFGSLRWGLGRLGGSLRHDSFGLQTCVRGCGLVCGAVGLGVNRYRR